MNCDNKNERAEECCDLNEAVSGYYGELKGYLVNRTKDPDLAEDLLQEIMLKAAYAHRNGVAVENIRAWFFQIARNTLADHYRKQSSQQQLIATLALREQGDDNFAQELRTLIDKYLQPMLSLLPEKYAEPLILADLKGIPHKVIAEKLGLSVTAVKSRVQRARQKLIRLMYKCCDVEVDSKGNFITCTVKDCCTPLRDL